MRFVLGRWVGLNGHPGVGLVPLDDEVLEALSPTDRQTLEVLYEAHYESKGIECALVDTHVWTDIPSFTFSWFIHKSSDCMFGTNLWRFRDPADRTYGPLSHPAEYYHTYAFPFRRAEEGRYVMVWKGCGEERVIRCERAEPPILGERELSAP